MSTKINIEGTIPDHCAGLRLDQALAQLFSDYSRGQLTKWIKAKQVSVNGKQLRPRDPVFGGEHIVIEAEAENTEPSWTAQNIDLNIVHEDEDILIVNKPAGMVVHPGAGNQNSTLVNALLHHAPMLEAIPRAGIVHRIDKETSGLLMVAKTLSAHHSLIEQLQARSVQRQYQAIAAGVMTAGGTVDAPIGRHHIDRKRMAVTQTGKSAVTHYRVEHRFRAHTYIKCKLETGRTHQIRVHMAHIRYPLVGDPVYGGRLKLPKGASESCQQALKAFKRQALHAGLLGFIHPKTQQAVSWRAELPEDMSRLLDVLTADQNSHDEN